MRHFIFVLLLSWALAPIPASACDFCMLGQGVSPYLTATGKGLTLDLHYTESDHVYDKATSIDPEGKKEAWMIDTLTGFFPVTEDLTVLVGVPYAVKTNLEAEEGTLTTGIGDITATGRYTLFRAHSLDTTFVGGLLGGIKFPTGTTNNRTSTGEPVDRHALPGTGSFDYNLGFTSAYATASGVQLTADLLYTIAGPGDWAGQSHRYGNSFNYSIKGYYRVLPREPGAKSLMPFIGVSGETLERERGTLTDSGYEPDTVNLSTGGTVLFADLGIYSMLAQDVIFTGSFSKAFYHHMNFDPGFEADPAENYKLHFGITYLF